MAEREYIMKMDQKPSEVAKDLRVYWETYVPTQKYVDTYPKEIVLEDAIYGIGKAFSEDYIFADGYERFLDDLEDFLRERKEKRGIKGKYQDARLGK